MGGLEDIGAWGFAYAILAAAAGTITAAAAATIVRRRHAGDEPDLMSGYDAMASVFDSQSVFRR
jgi:hypothetical protein